MLWNMKKCLQYIYSAVLYTVWPLFYFIWKDGQHGLVLIHMPPPSPPKKWCRETAALNLQPKCTQSSEPLLHVLHIKYSSWWMWLSCSLSLSNSVWSKGKCFPSTSHCFEQECLLPILSSHCYHPMFLPFVLFVIILPTQVLLHLHESSTQVCLSPKHHSEKAVIFLIDFIVHLSVSNSCWVYVHRLCSFLFPNFLNFPDSSRPKRQVQANNSITLSKRLCHVFVKSHFLLLMAFCQCLRHLRLFHTERFLLLDNVNQLTNNALFFRHQCPEQTKFTSSCSHMLRLLVTWMNLLFIEQKKARSALCKLDYK